MDIFELTTWFLMTAMLAVVGMYLAYGLWRSLTSLGERLLERRDRRRRLRPLVGPWE